MDFHQAGELKRPVTGPSTRLGAFLRLHVEDHPRRPLQQVQLLLEACCRPRRPSHVAVNPEEKTPDGEAGVESVLVHS